MKALAKGLQHYCDDRRFTDLEHPVCARYQSYRKFSLRRYARRCEASAIIYSLLETAKINGQHSLSCAEMLILIRYE